MTAPDIYTGVHRARGEGTVSSTSREDLFLLIFVRDISALLPPYFFFIIIRTDFTLTFVYQMLFAMSGSSAGSRPWSMA